MAGCFRNGCPGYFPMISPYETNAQVAIAIDVPRKRSLGSISSASQWTFPVVLFRSCLPKVAL